MKISHKIRQAPTVNPVFISPNIQQTTGQDNTAVAGSETHIKCEGGKMKIQTKELNCKENTRSDALANHHGKDVHLHSASSYMEEPGEKCNVVFASFVTELGECVYGAQSKELTREPPELVQHFRL